MSEETFKITYVSNGNKESFYFKHFVDLVYPSLNQLKAKLFPKCGVNDFHQYKNYKIYWIGESYKEDSHSIAFYFLCVYKSWNVMKFNVYYEIQVKLLEIRLFPLKIEYLTGFKLKCPFLWNFPLFPGQLHIK